LSCCGFVVERLYKKSIKIHNKSTRCTTNPQVVQQIEAMEFGFRLPLSVNNQLTTNQLTTKSASAGLQDANPTIRPYATPPPPIPTAPVQLESGAAASRKAPVRGDAYIPEVMPKFTNMGKSHPG